MRAAPRSPGFTLVELLTCIAIIGLLAGIAWPSYQDVMVRARRNDARGALLRIQAQQERLHLQSARYGDDLVAGIADGGLGVGTTSEAGHYRLEVTLTDDARGYVATATPEQRSPQRLDRECGALWVDETGRRGASATTGGNADVSAARCWQR